jgi:hypothetical protein
MTQQPNEQSQQLATKVHYCTSPACHAAPFGTHSQWLEHRKTRHLYFQSDLPEECLPGCPGVRESGRIGLEIHFRQQPELFFH